MTNFTAPASPSSRLCFLLYVSSWPRPNADSKLFRCWHRFKVTASHAFKSELVGGRRHGDHPTLAFRAFPTQALPGSTISNTMDAPKVPPPNNLVCCCRFLDPSKPISCISRDPMMLLLFKTSFRNRAAGSIAAGEANERKASA